MRVFQSIEQARGQLPGCALAIGNFDGVHLGHQRLFAVARESAEKAGGPSAGRTLELIAASGLTAAVVQPFDLAFAAVPAKDFVDRLLLDALGAREVAVGEDFSFGQRREGRVAQLGAWLSAGGASLTLVPKVEVEGLAISSTRIRELVLEGRVEAVANLLGRPFDLDGTVVAGMGRGKTLGFPTANVESSGEVLPLNGVYAVRARCSQGEFAGAANLGRKPTFGEGAPLMLEVHLIGYSGPTLLGAAMRVAFVARLRDEMRFPSLAALVEQIGRDVSAAARLAPSPVFEQPRP